MATKHYCIALWDNENNCWHVPTVDGKPQVGMSNMMAMRAFIRGAEAEGYDRDQSILLYNSDEWQPDVTPVLAWCNQCNESFDVVNGRCNNIECKNTEYRMTSIGVLYAERQDAEMRAKAKRAMGSMTVVCVVMQCGRGEITREQAIEALSILLDSDGPELAETILGSTGNRETVPQDAPG